MLGQAQPGTALLTMWGSRFGLLFRHTSLAGGGLPIAIAGLVKSLIPNA